MRKTFSLRSSGSVFFICNSVRKIYSENETKILFADSDIISASFLIEGKFCRKADVQGDLFVFDFTQGEKQISIELKKKFPSRRRKFFVLFVSLDLS